MLITVSAALSKLWCAYYRLSYLVIALILTTFSAVRANANLRSNDI